MFERAMLISKSSVCFVIRLLRPKKHTLGSILLWILATKLFDQKKASTLLNFDKGIWQMDASL